jgi:uncharacterized protein (DUF3084 family)
MKSSQYLEMIDSQLRESKENLDNIQKQYREVKAKHDALLNSRESYIRWVMGDEELQRGR